MQRGKARRIRIDRLNLPQPGIRSGRGQLDELTASIEEVGVLVPLVVRPLGEEFVVIAGAGRLEALQRLGWGPATTVPCVVVDVDDAEATLLALVENAVREDMLPFDEAEIARQLVQDYGYTQQQVARAIGKGQAAVSKMLAVFGLEPKVVAALRQGRIDMGAARVLLRLVDDRAGQRAILKRRLAEELSAPQVAALVAKRLFGEAAVSPVAVEIDGAGKANVRTTPRGKLRVVLEGDDRDALRKLWRALQKELG